MRLRHPWIQRRGFTLIELLVVIAILGVLAALTVGGVFKFIGSQRRRNTENAMITLNRVLQTHWKYVLDEAKKETDLPAGVLALADGDGQRARAIWIKLRLQEAFPMSYGEINGPSGYLNGRRKNISTYQRALAGKSAANDPATESAACLFLALSSVARGGQTLDVEGLSSNLADTDGDGMRELTDGFGKAMAFFRFPTGNPALVNPNANTRYCDPADPDGKLLNWSNATSVNTVQTMFNFQISAGTAPASAKFHVPTMVSAGPDGQFGLDGRMGITVPAQETDNIYSFKLR